MDPFIASVGVTIAAMLTIFAFSILVKESFLTRIAEYTVLAASAAHWLVSGIVSLRNSLVGRLVVGNYIWIPMFLLGFLFYTRYVLKYRWLVRYPTAILSGVTIALSIRGIMDANVITQLKAAILPLASANFYTNVNNVVMTIMFALTTWYFVFTYSEPKGLVGRSNNYILKGARYILMAAFGLSYGTTTVSRLSTLLGRLIFLVGNWLGIVKVV